jgi:PAT family beta-lactamase induction signal transducer AmpG
MGAFIAAFRSKRVGMLAALGFSSGLPLVMSGQTLSAWMATVGVDIKTIGLLTLVSLPYSLKFLWAPLLDRYALPVLGRRRGWMAFTQLALFAPWAPAGRPFRPARPRKTVHARIGALKPSKRR